MTDTTTPPRFNPNQYTDDDYTRILSGIGAKATPQNLSVLRAWRAAESGTHNNNPFNTTQRWQGSSGGGVQRYQTRNQGIAATVDTLMNAGARVNPNAGYYRSVVAGFRSNNPTQTIRSIVQSPWAAGHYGGSNNWQQSSLWKAYSGNSNNTVSNSSAGVNNPATGNTTTHSNDGGVQKNTSETSNRRSSNFMAPLTFKAF